MLLMTAALVLMGCAETPRRPTLRPIPPPPSSPPPGVSMVAPQLIYTNAASALQNATPTNPQSPASPVQQGMEVTTNFVPGTIQPPTGAVAGNGQVAPQAANPPPQYEVVPERPGPDYIWNEGYWSWQGAWVWVPGRWVLAPEPNIIVVPRYEYGWGYRPYYYHRGWGPRRRW